jgi:uncharacterized protein (TIGR02118 family)
MSLSFFLTFRHPADPRARVSAGDQCRFAEILRTTPGLRNARVYAPVSARDPYLNDGAPPQLAAELYFDRIEDLEASQAANGHLQALAASGAFPSLSGATVTQQAMRSRVFAVPDSTFGNPQGTPHCTYLVSYEGAAEDLNAWLRHYITSHPPIMARFPGIREIEICTRIDWRGFLPWPRVNYMLRNKVVFDSAAALTEALASPVRHEMRYDYQRFPPFTGPVSHYPMSTIVVRP